MSSSSELRSEFANTLYELREEFHKTGRYDDAGVKLDEITKLLFLKTHEERRESQGQENRFSRTHLENLARKKFEGKTSIAKALRHLFSSVVETNDFQNSVGDSIFGSRRSLNIQPSEDELASKIVSLLSKHRFIPSDDSEAGTFRYDLLNDAFGHFIRDTFRNTKEDAQYMTPPEAVDGMTEMAFADIQADGEAFDRLIGRGDEDFIVMDPTCGVGSFLVSALRKINIIIDGKIKGSSRSEEIKKYIRQNSIVGQDKVDRMVRLAKLNLLLFGGDVKNVHQGNSIFKNSHLDQYEGKVDLILTNPPFKAKFDSSDMLSKENRDLYPALGGTKLNTGNGGIPSELAMLDRCYNLLREGGRLLIVLPESIASGKGLEAKIRKWIGRNAILKSVVALPPVAFAQAGTRTRTCIVYLQKSESREVSRQSRIMVADCQNIGYDVVQRYGTPKRRENGESDLVPIVEHYKEGPLDTKGTETTVIRENPPISWISHGSLLNGRWTPSFYSPRRLNSLNNIKKRTEGEKILSFRLQDIAHLKSKSRESKSTNRSLKCISVSHVDESGLIDFGEVEDYNPKTKGRICRTGDVLISRLNPHILRCCVVPDRPYDLICSKEFEILETIREIDSYLLASLLRTQVVKDQIVSLTTGTSSSHSRIKRAELREILVPVPKSDQTRKQIERSLKSKISDFYCYYDRIKSELRSIDFEMSGLSSKEEKDERSFKEIKSQKELFD